MQLVFVPNDSVQITFYAAQNKCVSTLFDAADPVPKAKLVIIAKDGDSHGVGCLQGRGTSGSDPEADSKGDSHSGEVQDFWRSSHAGVLPTPY